MAIGELTYALSRVSYIIAPIPTPSWASSISTLRYEETIPAPIDPYGPFGSCWTRLQNGGLFLRVDSGDSLIYLFSQIILTTYQYILYTHSIFLLIDNYFSFMVFSMPYLTSYIQCIGYRLQPQNPSCSPCQHSGESLGIGTYQYTMKERGRGITQPAKICIDY